MAKRLTILITNIALADYAGSEVVVRDLAIGLMRRGHRPIAYAPNLGDIAAELTLKGIAVIDDLRKLAEPPDIIHGHHSIPCGEAIIRFPEVPAINVCHAFAHWVEAPAHFPQIGAYIAIDEACRDRLVHTQAIDPSRVVVLANAVDLTRIPTRERSIMERPLRAIAFGKAAAVPQIEIACQALGIEFAAMGYPAGRPNPDPEKELVSFDLAFASARSALESICCGCAVIACDARGSAGLVTSHNVDSLRDKNFGVRCLGEPITVEHLVREIQRYDRGDAIEVSERVRRDADLNRTLDALEEIYLDVLTGERRPHVTQEAHAEAVTRFLRENLPLRPADQRWPLIVERDDLRRRLEETQVAHNAVTLELAHERDELRRRMEETETTLLTTARQESTNEREDLQRRLEQAQVAHNAVTLELAHERDDLRRRVEETETTLAAARQESANEREDLQRRIEEAQVAHNAVTLELAHERDDLGRRLDETETALAAAWQESANQREDLQRRLEEAQIALFAAREEFSNQRGELHRRLQETQVALGAARHEVSNLNRSRLLRVGRFVRKIIGRP